MVKTFGLLCQVYNFDYRQGTAHDFFEARVVEDTRIPAHRRRGSRVVEVPLSLTRQGAVEKYAWLAEDYYIYWTQKQQNLSAIEEDSVIEAC
jgi:hypothetical protein